MAEEELAKMVKTINENKTYKVLTVEEYEHLMARASQGDTNRNVSFTPNPTEGVAGARPKTTPNLNLRSPLTTSTPRLQFLLDRSQQQTYTPSPYIPKLPIFSGSEEQQKGEISYEVWSFEVRCLQNSPYVTEHILLQSIRNSLRGTAREMLVPLGNTATVKDILDKLDGFFGNVYTGETLMQTFYNDFQKEESIISYGSRLEQTLSRAIKYGHIDSIAKDVMLCSKFWTGLKSQSLKHSTRHLYDSIKDFQSLLREIRKVDMEETNSKSSKKQSAQQCSGQVSTDDTNAQLLKQMSELMGRMKKMEEKLEQQSKDLYDSRKVSSNQQGFTNAANYNPRGRGYNRGYGRGYQNSTSDHSFHNSQRGNRGGRFRGGYRGGSNGRGAHRGGNSSSEAGPLN